MSGECLEMFSDLSKMISDEKSLTGNSVIGILKRYSSKISVFDMMDFTSQVIEENRYVQEGYRQDSQKSYIEAFLLRAKDISNDVDDYPDCVNRTDLEKAISTLKSNHAKYGTDTRTSLIFYIASLYSTFVLKEPIHPVGTLFPGSLRVVNENGRFLCPVRDANIDTPNAVCNICLAEQLDF